MAAPGSEVVKRRRKPPRSGKADRSFLTPYRVALRQKENEAIEMRIAGVPLRTIAERLGWKSGASAHKAIKRALEERAAEPAAALRQLEVERLDRMLMALWPAATSERKWLAVDRVLKIMERKAMMLGLDAPQRRIVDVVTHDAFEDVLAAKEAKIAELEAEMARAGSIDAASVVVGELEEEIDGEVVVAAQVVDNRDAPED